MTNSYEEREQSTAAAAEWNRQTQRIAETSERKKQERSEADAKQTQQDGRNAITAVKVARQDKADAELALSNSIAALKRAEEKLADAVARGYVLPVEQVRKTGPVFAKRPPAEPEAIPGTAVVSTNHTCPECGERIRVSPTTIAHHRTTDGNVCIVSAERTLRSGAYTKDEIALFKADARKRAAAKEDAIRESADSTPYQY